MSANHSEILQTVHDAFPGAIIWLNYPHLVASRNIFPGINANKCFAYMDAKVRCASESFERIYFLDFRSIMAHKESDYVDVVHHHGELSRLIVETSLLVLHENRL